MKRYALPVVALLAALTAAHLAPVLCFRVAQERRMLLEAAEAAREHLARGEPEAADYELARAIAAARKRGR